LGWGHYNDGVFQSGALKGKDKSGSSYKYPNTTGTAGYGDGIEVNASWSSDRYSDNATEVRPLYESCKFYIRY